MEDKLLKKAVLIKALTGNCSAGLCGISDLPMCCYIDCSGCFSVYDFLRGYRSARFYCSSALRIFFIPEKRCDELIAGSLDT